MIHVAPREILTVHEGLQNYDQSLEAALVELGLDVRGVAASEGWQVDPALLRNVLRRLCGICTHPQVGQLHRSTNNLKLPKSDALKSIGDVLEESLASTLTMCWVSRFQAMRDQNCRNLMDDRKTKASFIIRVIHASKD
jgi:E3 ubiquitin-protein ligase SHPRH